MLDTDGPGRALRRLLDADRAFADEPRRLGRALLDLLPYDDRAVRLLVLGAELGVPTLLKNGEPAAARQALTDRAGLQPDVADWIVALWQTGAGNSGTTADRPRPPVAAASALRLAAWPDGMLLVVARADAGVFGAVVDPRALRPPVWQLLATPPGRGSGDVAVTVDGEQATIVWAEAGVGYAAALHRRGTTLTAGPARVVVEPHDGLTVGDPIAALAVDDSSLDVIWSADSRRLRRSTWRTWSADAPDDELPSGCASGEAVTRIDAGRAGPELAWLAARTDRGRVLVSRWDLGRDDIASWVPLHGVDDATDVAVAGPLLLVGSADGVATVEAHSVWAGRTGPFGSAGWAGGAGSTGSTDRSLAAVETDAGIWLAVLGKDPGRLIRLAPDAPPPLSLWTA
ncbi:hypothetical protein ACWKSP_13790 [Micromonosporaceae bacterium Da 78-11]